MKFLKFFRSGCFASRRVKAEACPRIWLSLIGQGFLILIVTLLTFKFIMWNYWKVERAAVLAKGIINAPSAVNLTLTQKNTGTPLYRKSFVYNPNGNYYIINRFDITPYIDYNLNVHVTVNGQTTQSPLLYRFKAFNIITFKDYYLVFTGRDCGIEEFIELKDTIPIIIDSLANPSPSYW